MNDAYDLSISDLKLGLYWKIQNFQNWRNCEVLANIFVGREREIKFIGLFEDRGHQGVSPEVEYTIRMTNGISYIFSFWSTF